MRALEKAGVEEDVSGLGGQPGVSRVRARMRDRVQIQVHSGGRVGSKLALNADTGPPEWIPMRTGMQNGGFRLVISFNYCIFAEIN